MIITKPTQLFTYTGPGLELDLQPWIGNVRTIYRTSLNGSGYLSYVPKQAFNLFTTLENNVTYIVVSDKVDYVIPEPDVVSSLVNPLQDKVNTLTTFFDELALMLNTTDTKLSVNERILAIIGQPSLPPATNWRMSNFRSAVRLDNLEPLVATAVTQIQSLSDVVSQGLDNFGEKFDLLNSQRQLDLADSQLLAIQLTIQEAQLEKQQAEIEAISLQQEVDRLRILAIEAQQELDSVVLANTANQLESQQAQLLAQSAQLNQLQASEEATRALSDASVVQLQALEARLKANETQDEIDRLLAQQAEADAQLAISKATTANQNALSAQGIAISAQQAAALAQAKADSDLVLITSLTERVNTAQANLASTAQNLATLTGRVDTATSNISSLQTSVATAQTTATNAQTSVNNLAAKGRVILGLATPAVTLIGGNAQNIPITWSPPFADTLYGESVIRVNGGSPVVGFSITNKTTSGCTLVMTNTGTLSLLVPAGTVDVIISHQ